MAKDYTVEKLVGESGRDGKNTITINMWKGEVKVIKWNGKLYIKND